MDRIKERKYHWGYTCKILRLVRHTRHEHKQIEDDGGLDIQTTFGTGDGSFLNASGTLGSLIFLKNHIVTVRFETTGAPLSFDIRACIYFYRVRLIGCFFFFFF